jgi:hypothetical protein
VPRQAVVLPSALARHNKRYMIGNRLGRALGAFFSEIEKIRPKLREKRFCVVLSYEGEIFSSSTARLLIFVHIV